MRLEADIESDYVAKPTAYYDKARPEMIGFIPLSCRRALDVGCAGGAFGALLKKTRGIEVWGVEAVESAAAEAASKLDKVVHGLFHPDTQLPQSHFDCIIFNDVIEHILDPAPVLQYAAQLLAPGGVVVASIPNIRHFPTVWHLVMRGEWKYRDWGTLDKTHLRFYTRSSIEELFRSQGYSLDVVRGINRYQGIPSASGRLWVAFFIFSALCFGKFSDMKYQQFAVVARVCGHA